MKPEGTTYCLCVQKLNDESIMRSLLEIKTPIRSIARSYILTTPESSNVGILEVRLGPCHFLLAGGHADTAL